MHPGHFLHVVKGNEQHHSIIIYYGILYILGDNWFYEVYLGMNFEYNFCSVIESPTMARRPPFGKIDCGSAPKQTVERSERVETMRGMEYFIGRTESTTTSRGRS